jgi:hypothetical protein
MYRASGQKWLPLNEFQKNSFPTSEQKGKVAFCALSILILLFGAEAWRNIHPCTVLCKTETWEFFFFNLVSGRWKQEPMTNGASGVHIYRTPLLSPSIIPPQPLSIFSSLHTNGLVERAPLLVAWWQLSQNNGNSLFDVYFWVNLS